jgi:CBS domain-containing protein
MSLRELCETVVVTVDPGATVAHAARLMRDHHVGALVIVERGRPSGIVTDRDLATLVLASGLSGETAVAHVMTPDPVCVHVESSIADASQLMREFGVRRLPVVDSKATLYGIVTLDDLLGFLGEELSSLAAAVGHEQLREWRERGLDEKETGDGAAEPRESNRRAA